MNPVVPIGTAASDPRQKSYQDLKAKVHNDLLNRLNLERLTQMGQKEAEPEIRRIILEIIERSSDTTPLALAERETLVTDVLNELFGLGPLEALLRDPNISDILVNRFDQVYVERDGRLELTDIRLPRRPPPDADHRAHRQHRRPPHRRVEPDGGRASRATARASTRSSRRSRSTAPSLSIRRFRTDRARRRRPGRARDDDAADAGFPARRRRVPAQHHRVGRHRRRQDDAAQRALGLHLEPRARRDDRGRRRVDAAAAARRPARDAAAEHRRQGRRPAARPRGQRPAYAPRPHHRRRGPRATKPSTCCRP